MIGQSCRRAVQQVNFSTVPPARRGVVGAFATVVSGIDASRTDAFASKPAPTNFLNAAHVS